MVGGPKRTKNKNNEEKKKKFFRLGVIEKRFSLVKLTEQASKQSLLFLFLFLCLL